MMISTHAFEKYHASAAALSAALRRLATDPALRQRISSAARATVGLLTDAEVMHAHAGFYTEVCERTGDRRRA